MTTTPGVTFSSTETGTRGSWYRTSLSHRGGTEYDRVDVYTDAEAPRSVPFKESSYNEDGTDAAPEIVARYNPDVETPTMVIDDNKVVGSIRISTSGSPQNREDTTASVFPSAGAPAKPFDQIDRGEYTTEDRAADAAVRADPDFDPMDANDIALLTVPDDYTGPYRNLDRHPLRYTYETSGRLAGASGTFTCASDTEMSCRVTNEQGHFVLSGRGCSPHQAPVPRFEWKIPSSCTSDGGHSKPMPIERGRFELSTGQRTLVRTETVQRSLKSRN